MQGPCFVVYSLLGQPGGSRIPVPRENLAKFVDALIPLSCVHGAQRLRQSLAGELKHGAVLQLAYSCR